MTASQKADQLSTLTEVIGRKLADKRNQIPDLTRSKLHIALDVAFRKLHRLMRQAGISLEDELSA